MVKHTKQTKEQMAKYLEKHGSSFTEAAKIAKTSRTTLCRYLNNGSIPTEWMTAIRETLKDRKPVVKKKEQPKVFCSVCGKDISDDNKLIATNAEGLAVLLVEKIPTAGWYWSKDIPGVMPRQKMYRICDTCNKKLERIHKTSPKKVKGKVAVAKSK